jgi:hypothetical protein
MDTMPAMAGKEKQVNDADYFARRRNFSDKALSMAVQIGSLSRNQTFKIGFS